MNIWKMKSNIWMMKMEHMEDEDKDEDELDLESVIRELEEELDSSEVGDRKQRTFRTAEDSSEIGQQGPEGESCEMKKVEVKIQKTK